MKRPVKDILWDLMELNGINFVIVLGLVVIGLFADVLLIYGVMWAIFKIVGLK